MPPVPEQGQVPGDGAVSGQHAGSLLQCQQQPAKLGRKVPGGSNLSGSCPRGHRADNALELRLNPMADLTVSSHG
jgi:hypothetical protein